MTSFTPASTLADIVTAQPPLARMLEAHGLDYCCGGSATLCDACSHRDLDIDAVLAERCAAASAEPPPDWASMGPVELLEHIEATHHRYLWAEMPRLGALADKVFAVHRLHHPELSDIAHLCATIRTDLEPHVAKEERVIFPMVRELAIARSRPSFHCGWLRNPISAMLSEHDTVGDLLAQLRELTDHYRPPADGCASYRALFDGFAELEADTHLHIHKENNVLFPAIVALEDELNP